ncbi:MAG: PLP-dependent aspartate aminotransferase family protein [Reichenbachiella sp.]|uniref:trans-sulfuration enzyme family protein n=1 Tax=Reichenbachiella sp. TaxID=2184521 RepID=UPI0032655AB2
MQETTEILHSLLSDPLTGALSTPIYQTSTFVQEAPGVNKGFDYSRSNNPTRQVLEETIAKLENGVKGFAFASGLAAVDAVIKLCESGDEIVAVDDIYGGTFRSFEKLYKKFGITVRYTDTTEPENIIDNITPNTKLIWLETPTNPTLKIADIATISKIAHSNNCLVVVDNTFASPVLQKPLDLGADIVLHSATKYIAGHSDVIAGLVTVKTDELADEIKFIQNATGSILGPWDSWLTIRGIQTLSLRVEKQCRNAEIIAEYLVNKAELQVVHYPGLKQHPGHILATKQQKYYGAVVSFAFKEDTLEKATEFVTSTELFKLAESLGGVKSLCCHPATMTHKGTPDDIRRGAGINDSLVRLSIGTEDPTDLIQDLEAAFEKINTQVESAIIA